MSFLRAIQLRHYLSSTTSTNKQLVEFVSQQTVVRVHAIQKHIDQGCPQKCSVTRPQSLTESLHSVMALCSKATSSSTSRTATPHPLPVHYDDNLLLLLPLRDAADKLSQEIVSYVDMHRESVSMQRKWDDKDVCQWMDTLQLRIIGIRTLCSAASEEASSSSTSTIAAKETLRFVRSFDVLEVVKSSTAEVSAFCIEKYGVAPPIELSEVVTHNNGRPTPTTIVGVPEYVKYSYVEILKNAMRGMLDKYGASAVDDAPVPIRIYVTSTGRHVCIRVDDQGIGYLTNPSTTTNTTSSSFSSFSSFSSSPIYHHPMRLQWHTSPFPYFASTAKKSREEPTYHYSRDFGVPFTGAGVGMARASIYARVHGGGVSVVSMAIPGWTISNNNNNNNNNTITNKRQQQQQVLQPQEDVITSAFLWFEKSGECSDEDALLR